MRFGTVGFPLLLHIAGANENSVQMQVRHANSAGQSSTALVSYLNKLSDAASQKGYKVDDVTRDLLLNLRNTTDEALKNIHDAHKVDQTELDTKAASTNNCNAFHEYFEETFVKSALQDAGTKRGDHGDCRGTESVASTHTAQAWARVKSSQQDFTFDAKVSLVDPQGSPPGMTAGLVSEHRDWVADQIARLNAHLQEFDEKYAGYTTKHGEYETKDKECTKDMHAFEEAMCKTVDTKCSMCDTYEVCYSSNKKAYETAVQIIKNDEGERQFEFKNYKYMNCIIDNLLNFDETLAERTKALEACTSADHKVTSLVMTYPGVKAELNCTKLGNDQNPCDNDFEQREYVRAELFAPSSYTCQECATTSYAKCPQVSTVVPAPQYYRTTCATWEDARAQCKSGGGDLAVIKDEQTNTEATAFLNSFSDWGTCQGPYPWLGAYECSKSSKTCKWVDGTAWGYTHKNWQPHENAPQTYLHYYTSGDWGTWTGTSKAMGICQK